MVKKQDPSIGKFVIESLTSGMYDDPRFIFREYIQNSADSIDKAVTSGSMSSKQATIDIQLSTSERSISFFDNGTGVPASKFVSLLQDIAKSEKELGKDKGFRGIGRLGGLAYCQRLIFESSYQGEELKSIMIWDAKRLREVVADRSKKEDAIAVIRDVTESYIETENAEAHYFRVKLENVGNRELLDHAYVRDYLRMAAPVPFDGPFIFRSVIKEAAQKSGVRIDEYNVSLDGV